MKKKDEELTFEEFLEKKKIDGATFKENEPERFQEFEELFAQMHPKSFTMQKLFLINPIRKRYPLQGEASSQKDKQERQAKGSASSPVINKSKGQD